jgi:arylsulfatase A-like enzyme
MPVDDFDSRPLTPWLTDKPASISIDDDRSVVFVSNMGWPGVRRRDAKLILHTGSGARALFDLAADPGETRNVADDPRYRDTFAELDALVAWAMQREQPPLPTFATAPATTPA